MAEESPPTADTGLGTQQASGPAQPNATGDPKVVQPGSPTGGFEAQTMVRRVRTYTIVDSEFNSLAATTITASLLFFFASLFIGIGANCLLTQAAVAPDVKLSEDQLNFFYWATRVSFGLGGVFFAITLGYWKFGWSIFSHVKQTSREGKIISG